MNKTITVGVATVTCIQASNIVGTDKPLHTLVCEYPRVVHSQLLTHGVFSKCSSSTRAVPLEASIKQILENPAKVIWTANQSGMQGSVVTDVSVLHQAKVVHNNAMHSAIDEARNLAGLGIHKQNSGRLLEPFQNIKIVLTSTEWENWDWLRIHEDAQGEIADLARAMKEARDTADIMELKEGEWHVPFVDRKRLPDGELAYFISRDNSCMDTPESLNAEEARKVSSSVCAQNSYRKSDYSLSKADKMEGNLVNGQKVHSSPFEHQATPIPEFDWNATCEWPEGVTHMCRDYQFGSGNFKGWIQNRQLISRHDKALF